MKRLLKLLTVLLPVGLVLGVAGAVAVYWWAARDLPGFTSITDYKPALVTTVYAKGGQVLGYLYREKRFLVGLDQMSELLPKCFLAAEDSGFYQHEGVDPVAIFRAFLANLKSGATRQGGSTITQQVIKRLLLTPEKSLKRKAREAILAYRLEHYLNKNDILTIYLNQIYLGAGAYGVEAAARTYFGKHASELSLAECALIAGLPQAPSRYDPYKNLEAAKNRQMYVLERMLELGWVKREQYDAAVREHLVFKEMGDPSWQVGPYYLEEVRRWLIERFGEQETYEGGLTVQTACDLGHQAAADKAMHDGLLAAAKRHGWEGPLQHLDGQDKMNEFLKSEAVNDKALVPGKWVKVLVVDPQKDKALVRFGAYEGEIPVKTLGWAREPNVHRAPEDVPRVDDTRKVLKKGDVVWASLQKVPEGQAKAGFILGLETEPEVEGALVSVKLEDGELMALNGGFSFAESQFNRATQSKRQPGSSFKPIVYSAAMDAGFTAASIVPDAPFEYFDAEHARIWKPMNYENVFYGPTLLRTALAKSRNLVTIRVAQKIGVQRIIERARAMGLEADFQPNLSVALGSGEVSLLNLVQAYTAFGRGGAAVKPRMVLAVKSPWGQDLYKSQVEAVQAMSPQTAYIMTSLLKEVVRDGTGAKAKVLNKPLAGKTGTSNNEVDAWFMGFSPYLITGVHVGYDQPKPMGRLETGGRAALPIWLQYRQAVESQYPPADFPQPEGIVMVNVDAKTGLLAGSGGGESYFLPFKEGTEPTQQATAGSVPTTGGAPAAGDDLFKQF
jgi:penicillin-binding protein 1A